MSKFAANGAVEFANRPAVSFMETTLGPLYSTLVQRQLSYPVAPFNFTANSPASQPMTSGSKRKQAAEAQRQLPCKKANTLSEVPPNKVDEASSATVQLPLKSTSQAEAICTGIKSAVRPSASRPACLHPTAVRLSGRKPSATSSQGIGLSFGDQALLAGMRQPFPAAQAYSKIAESCANFVSSVASQQKAMQQNSAAGAAQPALRLASSQTPAPLNAHHSVAPLQGPAAPASSPKRLAAMLASGKDNTAAHRRCLIPMSREQPGILSQAGAHRRAGKPPLPPASQATTSISSPMPAPSAASARHAPSKGSERGPSRENDASAESTVRPRVQHAGVQITRQQLQQGTRPVGPSTPPGLKTKGRRFVPESLLSALGLSTLSLASPTSDTPAPPPPTTAEKPCATPGESPPNASRKRRRKKRKLSELMQAPGTPQRGEQEESCTDRVGLQKSAACADTLLTSSPSKTLSTPVDGIAEKEDTESKRPTPPKGRKARLETPHRLSAAAAEQVEEDARPGSKRLRKLKADKQPIRRTHLDLAPRTKCELRGVPSYFYPLTPPQDPGKPPTRREAEQEHVRAKDTASIWGKVCTKPRSGNEVRVMPVNENFHISSITDPNFRLGNKPFKYSFSLEGPDAYEPQRIIGGTRQALRKFPEPSWSQIGL